MSFHLNIKNLSSGFPAVILDRGVNYLHQGRVKELVPEGKNKWKAIVSGSKMYTVHIQLLDNDGVAKADCNCPYADTSPCKHIAAVLMAIEEEDGDQAEMEIAEEEKSLKTQKDDFTVLLESATKKELIQYFKKVTAVYPNIEDQITTMIRAGTSGLGKPGYRKIVKKALAPARRKGLMYGSEAHRHLVPVYELLEQADELKKLGSSRDVLDICQVIMEEMVHALQFIDDSSADVGDSLGWATKLLFEMAEKPLGKEEQASFFKWCMKSLNDKRYKGWDFEDDFLAMAVALAQTEKQIDDLNSFMDERIRSLEKDKKGWSSKYHLEKTVLQKVRLLRKTSNESEANALLVKYQFLSRVYAEMIETAWRQEEFDWVKDLAEAAIDRFEKEAPGLRKDWSEWLMKAAEKRGSPEEVLDHAQELLAEDPSMDRYFKVKSLVPSDNWDVYLQKKVLPALRLAFMGRRLLPEIFVLEEMWEELLKELKKQPNVYDLEQYQHHFNTRGELPAVDDIVGIYEQIIWEALANRADRKNYRNVCRILKKIIAFGAIEQADKLADDIREKYANRPSLLEELDNFGL